MLWQAESGMLDPCARAAKTGQTKSDRMGIGCERLSVLLL